MRLLLDECVDRRLAPLLEGHEVTTVPRLGWAGLDGSGLLSRAERDSERTSCAWHTRLSIPIHLSLAISLTMSSHMTSSRTYPLS